MVAHPELAARYAQFAAAIREVEAPMSRGAFDRARVPRLPLRIERGHQPDSDVTTALSTAA